MVYMESVLYVLQTLLWHYNTELRHCSRWFFLRFYRLYYSDKPHFCEIIKVVGIDPQKFSDQKNAKSFKKYFPCGPDISRLFPDIEECLNKTQIKCLSEKNILWWWCQ